MSSSTRRSLKRIAIVAIVAVAVIVLAFVIDAIRLQPAPASNPTPTSTSTTAEGQVAAALKSAAVPVIATLGGSLTVAPGASTVDHSWAFLLKKSLGDDITLSDHGYLDANIQDIRDEDGVAAVVKSQPTVVFFEPSTPANLASDLSIGRTSALTEQTIADLRAQLPDAIIVGILPSDIAGSLTNSSGETYADYIDSARTSLAAADIVCDVYTPFRNADLSVLLADQSVPNDAGNVLWASTIENCIGQVN